MFNNTRIFPSLPTSLTAQNLVSNAGTTAMSTFIDALGFADLCEDRLSQFVPKQATHRPSRIVSSLALMLAGGGEYVSDLDTFRDSPEVFGAIASNPTVSRFVKRATDQQEAFDQGFSTLMRATRERVWAAAGKRNPALQATKHVPLILDIDAILVTAHSEKELAAGDYKGGCGYGPIVVSCDYCKGNGTGEVLVVMMRAGNRPANTANDNIQALNLALEQLPAAMHDREGNRMAEHIMIRTDSAGATREFVDYVHSLGLQFSTSYALPLANERFIHWINNKDLWEPALDQHGKPRDNAWVIEATKVIELKGYPENTRLYLRAEPLHPGAKASLFDLDGHRVTAFLTNAPRYNVAFLDARHRARARCENRIKTLKAAGLGKLPFKALAANQLWANVAMLAMNTISWMQLTIIPGDHGAGVWDLKRWRYGLFSIAGKVISSARTTKLLIPHKAPEAELLLLLLEGIARLRERWRTNILTT